MIPASHRSMGHPASHVDICTAALWSCCRCPKCNPSREDRETNPVSAGNSSLPAAAAVRVIAPPAADGGNSIPMCRGSGAAPAMATSTDGRCDEPYGDCPISQLTPGDVGATPPDPAADRTFPLSGTPIGGLSDQISAVPYPAPKPLAAARLPECHDHPGGGTFLQERDA